MCRHAMRLFVTSVLMSSNNRCKVVIEILDMSLNDIFINSYILLNCSLSKWKSWYCGREGVLSFKTHELVRKCYYLYLASVYKYLLASKRHV